MKCAERWVDVVGYEGKYEVSDQGRVRSLLRKTPLVLKVARSKGRFMVTLCKDGISSPTTVHRIVARAFLGPAPQGKVHVAHWDGNPQNNCVENLRWATAQENESDKVRHGTKVTGERVGTSVLTDAEATGIREAYFRLGIPIRQLSVGFGVSATSISLILKRVRFGSVNDGYPATGDLNRGEANNKAKLCAEQVVHIRELAATGISASHIAANYGVSPVQVRNIVKRRHWKHVTEGREVLDLTPAGTKSARVPTE